MRGAIVVIVVIVVAMAMIAVMTVALVGQIRERIVLGAHTITPIR